MSIALQINSVDRTSLIQFEGLSVNQQLTNQRDSASFKIRKNDTITPSLTDDVKIYDGTEIIFAGVVIKINEELSGVGEKAVVYSCECADYSYIADKLMVSKTYESQTINAIITDIVATYCPGFNADNVESDFVIEKIVFNQVYVTDCIKRLADIVRYDWYIDENKSVNFFGKYTKSAPYNLTDTSGNYVYRSLRITDDGSQIVNRVKVRGGEYEGTTYTDTITVKGNDSKSFKLPYKMANLTIKVNAVSKTVGIDNIDAFPAVDVLYNYADSSFKFETVRSDGDKIEFSGNPKIRVFAVAEDSDSIALYGKTEKLIRDTSIKDNNIARRRAIAELYTYASSLISARFSTYNSGLRAGMTINIDSTERNRNTDLVIKSITFTAIDPMTFNYSVELVSTKTFDLIDILRKLLEIEPLDTDEAEVSEEIYSFSETVTIGEEIEFITPQEADEDVTIDENYVLTDVEPMWVLAPYVPTGQEDTKRAGRLNLSLTLY